ncbi:hypothetical protein BdWA1_000858 [Babesia duncani]|uniref:Uncharacterized protein n=1 Tax=Babesia duncani TaxID=323732 RepID=A0AAD9PMY3_9APIC|nr:hypothetical protein BdWA1_000858 [Babesia duncani]
MTQSGHQDFYFRYNISGSLYSLFGCQIDSIKFNGHDFNFTSPKSFMYNFTFNQAFVYACQIDSKLYPWLLQLYGQSYVSPSDSSDSPVEPRSEPESGDENEDDDASSSGLTTVNYFFKRDRNGTWKSHTFANFTDDEYQKIEHKEGQDKEDDEYICNLTSSGFSAALGYVYKESGSTSSILPSQLYSYLGESDKQHKYVSGSVSQEYSVSKFSSGTGSHSFEITLKGMFSGVDESSKSSKSSKSSEKSFTYGTENASTVTRTDIKLKEESSADIGSESGSASSCKANQSNVVVQPSGSDETASTSKSAIGSGGRSGSVQASGGSQPSKQSSSNSSSSSGTSEISTSSSEPSYQSKSSSNITGIVCGAVFGSVGLIGTGVLIYKCIR